jgi:hypothetical protein
MRGVIDRAQLRRFVCLIVAASAPCVGGGALAAEESTARPRSEILAWAVAQGALGDADAGVAFYPIGFSESGRFATLKRTSGYRGECAEEECPSGYHLVVYDLATDELLEELWVDELLMGPRVRDSASDAGAGTQLPVVTAADVERLLRKHGIAGKSFRRVETTAHGAFRAGGADFRLEERSPCLVEDEAGELPDACEYEQSYETVLTKLGTGSQVVARYSFVGLLWHQSRIGFVVDADETRLAIAYATAQFHEGHGIVDGIIVGADLDSRFEANRAGEPAGD